MPDDGTLESGPGCVPGAHGRCPTCADEGLVARVLELGDGTATALVEGEPRAVALDLVGEVRVGDLLLVHLGFAIARLDGEAA